MEGKDHRTVTECPKCPNPSNRLLLIWKGFFLMFKERKAVNVSMGDRQGDVESNVCLYYYFLSVMIRYCPGSYVNTNSSFFL